MNKPPPLPSGLPDESSVASASDSPSIIPFPLDPEQAATDGSEPSADLVFDPEDTAFVSDGRGEWVAVDVEMVTRAPTDSEQRDDVEIEIVDDLDAEEVVDDLIGMLLGNYRILDLLGEGGMGRVFLGEHTKIGRKVAIKILRSEYASRPDIVTRFFQEARAVNHIRHEHILDITDFFEEVGGYNYLVMELLTGVDLGQLVRSRGQLRLARLLDIHVQIAEGLAAAHDVGIIHRDLKPGNIFLIEKDGREDYVKLVDFGVAKLLGDARAGDHAGAVIGTPAYMSPEQASASATIDHRADIYSFGAMLYRMCTGKLPFCGKTMAEYCRLHLQEPPLPPSQVEGLPGRLPARLEQCILRCLEKSPDDRFQTMDEVAEELRVILRTMLGRRRRWLSVSAAAMAVGLMVGAAAFVVLGSEPEEEPSAPEHVAMPMFVAPPPPTTSAPTPAPETAAEAPGRSKLVFISSPPGAEVLGEGDDGVEPVGVTPFERTFDYEEREAEFTFRLKGYSTVTVTASLDGDSWVRAKLVRTSSPRKKVKTPPKVAPAKKKSKDIDSHERFDAFGGS